MFKRNSLKRRCIIPFYKFKCKKCGEVYEDLCSWDDTDKYPKVKCPECKSRRKEKLVNCDFAVVFTNPRGTSKEDSSTYAGGYNMELAKESRRVAEAKSHVGPNPYTGVKD